MEIESIFMMIILSKEIDEVVAFMNFVRQMGYKWGWSNLGTKLAGALLFEENAAVLKNFVLSEEVMNVAFGYQIEWMLRYLSSDTPSALNAGQRDFIASY